MILYENFISFTLILTVDGCLFILNQTCLMHSPPLVEMPISSIIPVILDGKSKLLSFRIDTFIGVFYFHFKIQSLKLILSLYLFRGQRILPIVVDPGLYLARRTQIFRATEKRPLPNAFKIFTGKVLFFL